MRDGRRLNRTLIAASGPGASYRWVDRPVPAHALLRYRVQAVRLDGTRALVGSVTVRR